tara:strand:+ start:3287 stop:3523 length:237 start_codon:yes stop_codon:yes gene_type:complete
MSYKVISPGAAANQAYAPCRFPCFFIMGIVSIWESHFGYIVSFWNSFSFWEPDFIMELMFFFGLGFFLGGKFGNRHKY